VITYYGLFFLSMLPRPPIPTLFPYTTLFRSTHAHLSRFGGVCSCFLSHSRAKVAPGRSPTQRGGIRSPAWPAARRSLPAHTRAPPGSRPCARQEWARGDGGALESLRGRPASEPAVRTVAAPDNPCRPPARLPERAGRPTPAGASRAARLGYAPPRAG